MEENLELETFFHNNFVKQPGTVIEVNVGENKVGFQLFLGRKSKGKQLIDLRIIQLYNSAWEHIALAGRNRQRKLLQKKEPFLKSIDSG